MPDPFAPPGIGDPAPDFALPDLSGTLVTLLNFRGRRTLVLFWDPACMYCRSMLPHVRMWEALPRAGDPVLLMVSTGSPEENQRMGLRSTVVLEPADRPLGEAFGAEGTPTAVLLDEHGRCASILAAGGPAITELMRLEASPRSDSIELTVGIVANGDVAGVYSTLQSLRLYQDLEGAELLVIDTASCDDTKPLVETWIGGRYIRATDASGTAASRDLVFREARGEVVLCCDCGVLFAPGAIARLKQYYRDHPDCLDLLHGPLVFDDGQLIATHLDPVWRDGLWGAWALDYLGLDADAEPFDIPMQAMSVFSCRKRAWWGFPPEFRGLSGTEGYIHEKFRQVERRCLCLPWLRWMTPDAGRGTPADAAALEERLRDYVLGHVDLGLEIAPVLQHFSLHIPEERMLAIVEETVARERARLEQLAAMQPLVSVVMPVYNGERYLRQAVRSVLRQTLPQIELIIVNDGSTDRTAGILAELLNDPRVQVIEQRNSGEASARNTGIAAARAEYVAMHDADDISLPHRLATQHAFLERHPERAAAGSFAGSMRQTGEVTGEIGAPTEPEDIASLMPESNCFVHGTVMVRRTALQAAGGYREAFAYACDYDLWLRLTESEPVANISEVLYLYRGHGGSMSSLSGRWLPIYGRIAQELARERRDRGSDLLMRAGHAAFLDIHGLRLQRTRAAGSPVDRASETSPATTTSSVILFAFHGSFDVCAQRLEQLRKYNPDTPIYGLFRGRKEEFAAACSRLGSHLEHLYLDRHEDAVWKWLHADIPLKEWFRNFGHTLTFDHIYAYEYDLATFAPLQDLYPTPRPNTLYFSNVMILTPGKRRQWQWTALEPFASQFEAFSRYMQEHFGLRGLDTAILGPAPLLPAEFVKAFAATEDIDWVQNEISFPAYARALGFSIADNGFYPGPASGAEMRYFNGVGQAVEERAVLEQLQRSWGRRIFHPVKYMLYLPALLDGEDHRADSRPADNPESGVDNCSPHARSGACNDI